jgi:hypothetical protein
MYIGKFINIEFLLRGMRGNRRYLVEVGLRAQNAI